MAVTDQLPLAPGASVTKGETLDETAEADSRTLLVQTAWTLRLRTRLVLCGLLIVLLTAGLSGWLGLRAVEHRLEGEMISASRTVGNGLVQQFELALEAGIPFDRLTGVEDFLATTTSFDERIGFAALLDGEGAKVAAAGRNNGLVPDRLTTGALNAEAFRPAGHLAVIAPISHQGTTQGYVLVGVGDGLPSQTILAFTTAAALATLALLVLLHEALRATLFKSVERPAEALARLAAALERGDLSRTTWLAAPGSMGRLLLATRHRLAGVNTAFHAFLLSAFAARAGHFEPPVLREITDVVRRGLGPHRLPPVAGAWPVAVAGDGLFRLAAFALLLGEAVLLPGWWNLGALEALSRDAATALLALPLLLAIPLGYNLAGRALAGFAPGMTFTAGALIAAAGQLGLALADTPEAVAALRILGGLGIGMAFHPLGGGVALTRGALLALVAGTGPGFLFLALTGSPNLAPLAALVTAIGGLLVGQSLPERNEATDNASQAHATPRSRPLPLFSLGLLTALLPTLLANRAAGSGPPDIVALLAVVIALAAGVLLSGSLAPALGPVRTRRFAALGGGLCFALAAFLSHTAPSTLHAMAVPALAGAVLAGLLLIAATLTAEAGECRPRSTQNVIALAGGAALGLLAISAFGWPLLFALAAAALLATSLMGRR
ncbi:hypothetical protein [Aquibaculum arenosum]|uniref:Major facilitator superfamily (MFS) profile domain-containing protein n=1 Tax=Aquibaculum arenosum TaxID=3032591 RepID=A0ABT5YKN3_9PROT|nr:hypothetical protein [Fodinicurvata sp. CAU 1616]MDF2095511.1 hypothetical protein [Fodinicurvata sp. CAU 1616]